MRTFVKCMVNRDDGSAGDWRTVAQHNIHRDEMSTTQYDWCIIIGIVYLYQSIFSRWYAVQLTCT